MQRTNVSSVEGQGWFGGPPPGPPENEIGQQLGLSLVLGRTDEVAVWLSEFVAYRTGLAFSMSLRRRSTAPPDDRDPWMRGIHPRSGPPSDTPTDPDDDLLLGISYPDGRLVMDPLRRRPPVNPVRQVPVNPSGQPILTRTSGRSSHQSAQWHLWLSPPPPDGPVTFVLAWRAAGIPESQHVVNHAAFTTASTQSTQLWPWQPPQPAPPQPQPEPALPTKGWFGDAARQLADHDSTGLTAFGQPSSDTPTQS